MPNEIQIEMTLPEECLNNKLSIDKAIEVCKMGKSKYLVYLKDPKYSNSKKFDFKAKARKYALCQRMLEAVKNESGKLKSIDNKSKKLVTFTFYFNIPEECEKFYKNFVLLLKAFGYKTPDEKD